METHTQPLGCGVLQPFRRLMHTNLPRAHTRTDVPKRREGRREGRKLANRPADRLAGGAAALPNGREGEGIKNACEPMKAVGESLRTHHTQRLSRKPAADQSSAPSTSPPAGRDVAQQQAASYFVIGCFLQRESETFD